jgi:hypothetical protein
LHVSKLPKTGQKAAKTASKRQVNRVGFGVLGFRFSGWFRLVS